MRPIKSIVASCMMLNFLYNLSFTQYYSERVLEKSFEQTDFFFSPTPLLPYGVGGFRSVSPTLFQDPLSRLAVNPAFFSIDSSKDHYAYFDFRSVSEIRTPSSYIYPMYDYRVAMDIAYVAYPRYYFNTRKELQPIFSGAYLTRLSPGVFAGVTYQAIFQDDKYYPIPQDIYRSVLGYDYEGAKVASDNFPIVDKYKGEDDIHHLAHIISFHAAFEMPEDLELGAKLARTTFNRDGSFGSQNLWDRYYYSNYTSLWGNMESREQKYRDWDLTAGLNYQFGDRRELGLFVGRLWGAVDQGLLKTDTSFYGNGTPGVGTSWSYYTRSGLTDQSWNHNGTTTYGGIQFNSALSSSATLSWFYTYSEQRLDIDLVSSISDTSFNSYRYQYNDTSVSSSGGFYALVDSRTGAGTKLSDAHRFLGSIKWRPNDNTSVTVGLQIEIQSSETRTDEAVLSRRQSQYSSSYGQWNYASFDRAFEQKRLLWTFTTEVTTIQIPIIFQWQATNWLDALIGISRTMSSWDIDDVTLAVINVRDHQYSSGSEHKENFGERYTMPRERVSDVRTSILAGLTARPSTHVNVRLLATPNVVDDYQGSHIQDIRWWLSFQLNP